MKLQTYMREKELSPADFAATVGCSHWAVRKWMYGQRVPRSAEMQIIRDVTSGQVAPEDFYDAPSCASDLPHPPAEAAE